MDGLLLPCREYYRAAVDNPDLSAQSLLSGGTPAVPEDIAASSNWNLAGLTFPDAGAAYADLQVRLPTDWYIDGGLTAVLFWSTPASTGSARWVAYTAYVMAIDGDQDTIDPSPNAEQAMVAAAASNADRLIATSFDLDTTNARPGALLYLEVGRTPDDGDDDLGDDAHLIGIELQYTRRVVLS